MTSKPLSIEQLIEHALISHEYNDVTGTVTVNATDALLAIANSINRLASVQEKLLERQEIANDRMMAMMVGATSDRPGHA